MSENLDLISEGSRIVAPSGFVIPEQVSKIHRISQARAEKEGLPLAAVLDELEGLVRRAGMVVAHNMSFDSTILGVEFFREGRPNVLEGAPLRCTMRETATWVGIPGKYGPKWPSLDELHRKLFGEGFEEAHDAGVDVRATARCLAELISRGKWNQ